jgi:hypothetical protein
MVFFAVIPFLNGYVFASGENWLTGYTYRKQIAITGSTDGALNDYQIRLTLIKSSGTDSGSTIYLGSNVLDTFNDIRFTDSGGNAQLNYWIESVSGSTATVWVKVNLIPASPEAATIYLYYGKSGDMSASSGAGTFAFFDDFNDNSIDTDKWTVAKTGNATYAEASGQAQLANNTATANWYSASFTSKTTFGPGHAIRMSQYWSLLNGNINGQAGFFNSGWTDRINMDIGRADWVGGYFYYNFKSAKSGTETGGSMNNPNSSWKTYDLIWTSAKAQLYVNGSSERSFTDTTYIPTNSALNAILEIQPGAGTGYIYTDWFLVRKITNNEPTVSSGEQVTEGYTLTYTAATGGTISGTSPQSVNPGGNGAAVTAVASTGYHFVNWSDDSTDNPRTDTNVSQNISVTANFAIDTHTLTYVAGEHGSIAGTNPQTVNYGSDGSQVTAVADEGYHFTSWDDENLTASRTDTNVTADHTYTASFEITDQSAPTVGNATVYTSSNGAIITWSTNENSSALINYGLNTSCLNATSESDTSPRDTDHSVTISNLVSCTRYYYKAQNTDNHSNTGYGSVGTFKTTGCTGDATITATGQGTATSDSGGSLSQGNIALTIPASFKDGTSLAVFQANQLSNTDFIETAGTPPGKSQVGTDVYTLKALVDENTPVSNFDSAITVVMSYSDSDLSALDESSLWIYRYDGLSWNALSDCVVNASANTVTCTTENFSDFAIFGTASALSPSAASGGSSAYIQTSSSSSYQNNKQTTKESSESEKSEESDGQKILELENQIALLKAKLAQFLSLQQSQQQQAQLGYQFINNLKIGDSGEDVKQLQIFLNDNGFQLAESGEGSPDNETDYFGNLTMQGVIKFQQYYAKEILYPAGLSEPTGYFYGYSRAKANEMIGK